MSEEKRIVVPHTEEDCSSERETSRGASTIEFCSQSALEQRTSGFEGGRVQEKGKDIQLKNGSRWDYRFARAYLNLLRDFELGQPETFQVLCGLARGESVPPIDLQKAELAGLVANGQLRDVVRDVLLSALTPTPEGPVLSDPFKPSTEEERETLRRAERASEDFLVGLTEGLSPPEPSPPRPR